MTERKDLEIIANDLGKAIQTALDSWGKGKLGFAFLVFDFDGQGNLAWISNAKRKDMIKALEEFIEKNGGISVLKH